MPVIGSVVCYAVITDAAPQPADNILYITRLGTNHTKDDLVTSLTELFKPYKGFQTVNVVQSAGRGIFTGYAVFDTSESANTARKVGHHMAWFDCCCCGLELQNQLTVQGTHHLASFTRISRLCCCEYS